MWYTEQLNRSVSGCLWGFVCLFVLFLGPTSRHEKELAWLDSSPVCWILVLLVYWPNLDSHIRVHCVILYMETLLSVGVCVSTGNMSGTNMAHVQQKRLLWIVNINTSARHWNYTIKWIWTGTAHPCTFHFCRNIHFTITRSSSQYWFDVPVHPVFAIHSLVPFNLLLKRQCFT